MRKKIVAAICSIVLCATMLTGCNKTIFDTNYTFDTAIITINNEIYIIDIKAWKDYEGEQIQLTLKDDSKILVSSFNTILVNKSSGSSEIIKMVEKDK